MNIQPLLEALDLQEDAARTLTDDLRTQAEELQARLRDAETHLEHHAITRKTVTALADRIPTQTASPDLPEHPDYPRIVRYATAVSEARAGSPEDVLWRDRTLQLSGMAWLGILTTRGMA
jgi:hypothetical protein